MLRGNMRALMSVMTVVVLATAISGCSTRKKSSGDQYDPKTGGIGLGTLQRVHFGFDNSLIDDKASSILQSNARVINNNPKMRVLVEGHCDDRGTNEYNVALGERRGKAALAHLVSLGVARNRLEVKSWGEERPLDVARRDRAYSLNRRGEFVILAK